MPSEGDGADTPHIQDGDRSSKQEREQGKDPKVHDQRFSKEREISNILEHGSHLDSYGSLHIRVDQAGIIIGTCMIEPLACGLGCTKEIRGG
jgi:hypothetical protein